MRKLLFGLLFNLVLIQSTFAESSSSLHLRASVVSVVKTKVTKHLINDHQTRIEFKSQNNQKYESNSHKVELSGHEQEGLKAKVKIASLGSSEVDYEILIDHLENNNKKYEPIFIKISAN